MQAGQESFCLNWTYCFQIQFILLDSTQSIDFSQGPSGVTVIEKDAQV